MRGLAKRASVARLAKNRPFSDDHPPALAAATKTALAALVMESPLSASIVRGHRRFRQAVQGVVAAEEKFAVHEHRRRTELVVQVI